MTKLEGKPITVEFFRLRRRLIKKIERMERVANFDFEIFMKGRNIKKNR